MYINYQQVNDSGKIRFDQLAEAQLFYYEGRLLMYIDDIGECNAVDLSSGSVHHFASDMMVDTVSAELVVSRIGDKQ
jgi:hypothetical protein